MIIKYDVHSLFTPDVVFKRAGFHRVRWKFLSNDQFPVSRDTCQLDSIAGFLNMDKASAFALLVKELDKGRGMVGVMVKDGLYCHPVALGKVLLRLASRLEEG